jgi:outer membrane protein assembly factor BamB
MPTQPDGVCCVADDGSLYALSAETGKVIWKSAPPSPAPGYGLTAAEGLVCFSNDDERLYALDSSTGQVMWSFRPEVESWGCKAIIKDGLVCVSSWSPDYYSANIDLLGLDSQTGKVKWRLDSSVGQYPDALAMAQGLISYPGIDGRIHGVDAGAGRERFVFNP